MDKISKALQSLISDHAAPIQLLMANLPLGGNLLSVANSSRFRPEDEVLLVSDTSSLPGFPPGITERARIKSIPDYNQIELETPVTRGWTTAEGAYVLGAVNHIPLQRVYVGSLPTHAKFPCVTIVGASERNQWSTLEATDHEYRFDIRAYIQADNFEVAELYIMKFARKVRELLMDHIHPIVDGTSYPITVDVPSGAKVVTITNTADVPVPGLAFIRDAKTRIPAQESVIRAVLSPTDVEVVMPLQYDYEVARGAEFIVMKRYLYDTRPEDIQLKYNQRDGGLLRVAQFNYFAKEQLVRPGNILS